MKWVWMSVGFGAGFVLGTRVGQERFDRFVHRSKRAADDIGLTSASERVVDSARSAGADLHNVATARSEAVVGHAADAIVEHIDSVGESVRPAEAGT
jgi:hypothetical protein